MAVDVNTTNVPYLELGLLLFAAGTLLGIPHGLSKRSGDATRTELWRVAHLSTCVGGVSLLGLTLAAERVIAGYEAWVLLPFTLAAFLFFAACTLSGCLGVGWDCDRSMWQVRVVYALQISASLFSVAAVAALLLLLSGTLLP